MNVLFALSQGLGNIFQCLPVVSTLEKVKGWKFSYLICEPNFSISEKVLCRPTFNLKDITREDIENYDGVLAIGKAWNKMKENGVAVDSLLLNDPKRQSIIKKTSWNRSEVDWHLDIVREQGVKESEIEWGYDLGVDDTVEDCYDVVFANGYNLDYRLKNNHWQHKQYPYWGDVASFLHKHTPSIDLCCVGTDKEKEYVSSTKCEIGRPLEQSLALVKNAKVLVANDTGLYHAAPLLDTPAITLVTFTKPKKIYDRRFHKNAELVMKDVPCREHCYEQRKHKNCKNKYVCKELSTSRVIKSILQKLSI